MVLLFVTLCVKGTATPFANEFIGVFEDWDASCILEVGEEER